MIKHIVMWQVKGDAVDEHCNDIKTRLEQLPGMIPQIREYEVGINMRSSDRAFDIVLISSFDSQADLETYSAHPAHQEVVAFTRSVTTLARFVDFEV